MTGLMNKIPPAAFEPSGSRPERRDGAVDNVHRQPKQGDDGAEFENRWAVYAA